MPSPRASRPPPLLGEFLEHLRRLGFDVGVGTWLQVAHLLDTAEVHDPARVAGLLCPIVARSADEQERFHQEFARFFPGIVSGRRGGSRLMDAIAEVRASRPTVAGGGGANGTGNALPGVPAGPLDDPLDTAPKKESPAPAGVSALARAAVRAASVLAVLGVGWIFYVLIRPPTPDPVSPRDLLLPPGVFVPAAVERALFEAGGGEVSIIDTELARAVGDSIRFEAVGEVRFQIAYPDAPGVATRLETVTAHSREPAAFEVQELGALRAGKRTPLQVSVVNAEGVELPESVLEGGPVFRSADPSVAVVDGSDLVGVAPGVTVLTVSMGGAAAVDTVVVRVQEAAVPARLVIEDGAPVALSIGDTRRLAARVLDEDGDEVTDATVSWESGAPDVVAVRPDGTVQGLTAGLSPVRARYGPLVAVVEVATDAADNFPATLEVRPARVALHPGQSVPVVVTVRDGRGRPITSADSIVWVGEGSPSAAEDRIVRAEGDTVWALAPGTVTLGVEDGEGRSGQMVVFVEPRPLVARVGSWLEQGRAEQVLPLLVFLLAALGLWRSGLLGARRERQTDPPALYRIRPPAGTTPYPPSLALAGAARAMQRREASEVSFLDLSRTLDATIEAGGHPTFVYRSGTRPPEYLVLLDRTSFRDHQPRLYHELVAKLADFGVLVAEFTYEGDPRVLDDAESGARVRLVDLVRRFPAHRLLVFGDGGRFLHPVTGDLQPWVEAMMPWPERALLTPVAPKAWGSREIRLASAFVLLPGTLDGVGAVLRHFESERRPDLRLWHRASTAPPPPELSGPDPMGQLRAYLDEDGFQWLCALAVYPELHWDLTLFVGSMRVLGGGVVTEDRLLRLVRLPWFRDGFIDSDIRARLLDEGRPEVIHEVRSAILRILEGDPPPPDSIAADRYHLHLVVQRVESAPSTPEEVARLEEALRRTPLKLLSADAVVLRFLDESDRDAAFELSPRARRRLRRYALAGGRRWGGPLLSVAAGLMVALGALALMTLLHRWEDRRWLDTLAAEPILVSSLSGEPFEDVRVDGFARFRLVTASGREDVYETTGMDLVDPYGASSTWFEDPHAWMPWRWTVSTTDGSVRWRSSAGREPVAARPLAMASLAVPVWPGGGGSGGPPWVVSADPAGDSLRVAAADGTTVVTLTGFASTVVALDAVALEDGRVGVAAGSEDGSVRMYWVDVTDGRSESRDVGGADDTPPASVSLHPDGSLLVSRVPYGVDRYDPSGTSAPPPGNFPAGDVSFGTSSERYASTSVSVRFGGPSIEGQGIQLPEMAEFARFAPGDSLVAVVSREALTGEPASRVSIWVERGGEFHPRTDFQPHFRRVTDLRWTPDGAGVVTVSEDGTAAVWSADTGRWLTTLPMGSDPTLPPLSAVRIQMDGHLPTDATDAGDAAAPVAESSRTGLRALGRDDGTIRLRGAGWPFRPGRTLRAGTSPIRALTFTSDGTVLLAVDGGPHAYAWRVDGR